MSNAMIKKAIDIVTDAINADNSQVSFPLTDDGPRQGRCKKQCAFLPSLNPFVLDTIHGLWRRACGVWPYGASTQGQTGTDRAGTPSPNCFPLHLGAAEFWIHGRFAWFWSCRAVLPVALTWRAAAAPTWLDVVAALTMPGLPNCVQQVQGESHLLRQGP